jgi:hypothetical protein
MIRCLAESFTIFLRLASGKEAIRTKNSIDPKRHGVSHFDPKDRRMESEKGDISDKEPYVRMNGLIMYLCRRLI